MVWRISPSRPTMGSMRPLRASSVRSWVYWLRIGSSAGASLRLAPWPLRAPVGLSRDGRVHSGRLLRSVSRETRSSEDALLNSKVRRSSRSSRASNSRPERMLFWPSMLAWTTASSSRPMVWVERAGVRVLPALNSSSAWLISALNASRSRPKRGSRQAKSPPSISSNSSSKCSIST
ncbi:hypothetical protein D9M68_798440 [compost metagenome]